VQLKSKYSQILYTQLRRFRTTGWMERTLDEFRDMMGYPVSYTPQRIADNIIRPAVEECRRFIDTLNWHWVHGSSDKPGRKPVTGVHFSFVQSALTHDDKVPPTDIEPVDEAADKEIEFSEEFSEDEFWNRKRLKSLTDGMVEHFKPSYPTTERKGR